jgi:rubrerythrin
MPRKVLLAVALLSLTFIAAGEKTSGGVQRSLTDAIINERTAIARYNAFAEKAQDEGYFGVADLFRAAARAETIHLARFTAVMNTRGLELPTDTTRPVIVGSTSANLQTAIAAENGERDGSYRSGYNTASEAGDTEVARIFDQTRDVETEHANLAQFAVRNLDQMKEPRAYKVCEICGYTTDARYPVCPLCQHLMH